MLYEIHTINTMFTIDAAYFKANQDGVMFFDEQDNGIAFVPNVALNLVRVNLKAEEDKRMRERTRELTNFIGKP